MSASAVIATARGEIGYKENPPDSNRTKYWADCYPAFQGQPWCVVFLMWCFAKAKESSAFFGGAFTASCGTLLRWYREQGQTVDITQVQPGDILILDFSGRKTDTQHCGLVTEVGWISHGVVGWVKTIEGNTSKSGSQSNGGEVCEKTRYPSQIVAVCRPKFKEEPPVPKDDLTGHWAEDACRKAEDKGIMRGYPDGSWCPDKTLTRAELATVLDRLGLLENGEGT